MSMSGEYLAKVAARPDSSRLSEKSILNPARRPLSVRPMLSSLNPIAIKRAIVSIDSAGHQQTAKSSGDDRPWFRCVSPVQNPTTIADVTRVVLDEICHANEGYWGLELFQLSSPLHLSADIAATTAPFEVMHASAVVQVCRTGSPPAWLGQISADLRIDSFTLPRFKNKRSQALDHRCRKNSALYKIGNDVFRREHGFMPEDTQARAMPSKRSVDIDKDFDIAMAEAEILLAERIRGGQ